MTESARLKKIIESRREKTIFSALGIQIDSYEPELVVLSLQVDERHLQFAGFVHGGVYVVLAESAASLAAAFEVDAKYEIFGRDINASHVRFTQGGVLKATSSLLHRGNHTLLYATEVRNEQRELVSAGRCTVSFRERNSPISLG